MLDLTESNLRARFVKIRHQGFQHKTSSNTVCPTISYCVVNKREKRQDAKFINICLRKR